MANCLFLSLNKVLQACFPFSDYVFRVWVTVISVFAFIHFMLNIRAAEDGVYHDTIVSLFVLDWPDGFTHGTIAIIFFYNNKAKSILFCCVKFLCCIGRLIVKSWQAYGMCHWIFRGIIIHVLLMVWCELHTCTVFYIHSNRYRGVMLSLAFLLYRPTASFLKFISI